jgi:hypothetical protein
MSRYTVKKGWQYSRPGIVSLVTSRLGMGKSLTFFLQCSDLQDHHTVLPPLHHMLYEYVLPVIYCRFTYFDSHFLGQGKGELCRCGDIWIVFYNAHLVWIPSLIVHSLYICIYLIPRDSSTGTSGPYITPSPFTMDVSVSNLKGRVTDKSRKNI